MNKEKNQCTIIHVANPGDHNLVQKKFEKLDNYSELRLEVARMWNKKTVVVPIITIIMHWAQYQRIYSPTSNN